MKLNNIGFKKLLALTLTSSALILTGCHNKRIDMEKGLYFTGFKDVITADYLDFNIDEPKILVDENCVPIEIKKREQGKGEKLIENFMVQANESVASLIYFMNLQ